MLFELFGPQNIKIFFGRLFVLFLSIFTLKIDTCLASEEIQFVSIEGDSSIIAESGVSSQAKVGQLLNWDQRLVTGKNGRVRLLLQDDTILDIKPNSQVSISHASSNMQARDTVINLQTGDLRTSITQKLKTGERINVRTPSANFSVRGTDFNVKTDESNQKNIQLHVFEGAVEASVLTDNGPMRSLTLQNHLLETSPEARQTKELTVNDSSLAFEQSRNDDMNIFQSITIDQESDFRNTGNSTLLMAYKLKNDLIKIPSSASRFPQVIIPSGALTSPFNLNFQTLTVQSGIQ